MKDEKHKKHRKRPHKSILVIGMGRFGRHLAIKLQGLGNSVLAIDKVERVIEDLAQQLDNTLIADCKSEAFMQTLGISNFDICYVTIGEDFEASVLITSYLKRCGAQFIVTKASRNIHFDILKSIGADEVVYPEWEWAEKVAIKHSNVGVIDYLPLDEGYSIYEVEAPAEWFGKSIVELKVRQKYDVNILTIKQNGRHHSPSADYVFSEGDTVTLMGTEKAVLKCLS